MIFSKNNLQILQITGKDKAIPVLNNVCFEANGMTIACNNRTVLAVLPTPLDRQTHSVLYKKHTSITEQISLSMEQVKDILKNIPNDTTFDGLLEMIRIDETPSKTYVTINDGKNNKEITVKKFQSKYINYKAVMRRLYDEGIKQTLYLDRRRLQLLLDTIGKFSADGSIALHITEKNNIIVRGVDPKTGQQYIGFTAGVRGEVPEFNDIEKQLLGIGNQDATKEKSLTEKGLKKKSLNGRAGLTKKKTLRRKTN